MLKLEMKAGALISLISKMTARESGGSALFSPILVKADVKKKSISWSWITGDHTAFTWGKAEKLKLSGESGDYVIDSEIVDWLKNLFSDEENVVLEHRGSTVYLKGDKWEGQFTPTDADATRVEEALQMKIKDNVPMLGDFKWSEVGIKASEINTILSPTSLVYGQKEIKVVRLTFNKKGSLALIGSLEAHSTGIARPLDAKVKKGFEIILGSNFAEVMSVLDGDLKLFGIDTERPLWILKEDTNLIVGYLVAQYGEVQEREKAEAEDDEEEVEEAEESEDEDDSDIDLGDDDG